MKRLAGLLAAAVLAAGVAVFTPASPASADEEVCAGQGTANTGAPLFLPPPVGTNVTTTFRFSLSTGSCVSTVDGVNSVTASGVVSGACGLSSGSGITDSGHNFDFLGVGSMLVLTGPDVEGVVNATPDALNGHLCTTGASQFIISGAAVLEHV